MKLNSKRIKLANFREFWRPSVCGTAFVKYRHELSPKYLRNYKEKERKIKEIDKKFNYYNKKPTNEFEAKVSGVNCTIPTKWMAARFRSSTSNAFAFTPNDKRDEISTRETNRLQHMKIREQNSQNFERRPISLREIRSNKSHHDKLHNKQSELNMMESRRNTRFEFSLFEVSLTCNFYRNQI